MMQHVRVQDEVLMLPRPVRCEDILDDSTLNQYILIMFRVDFFGFK